MKYAAATKPTRPWGMIAAEIKLQSRPTDPAQLLKLVEEPNRAMAEQGVESIRSVSGKSNRSRLSKTA